MHRHITKQPDCSHGKNIMPEPSKSDSECIAGLELPKQDNAHAPHPVSAAIIYAGVFTMTCALYSSILSACWGFLLIILPGYAIVPAFHGRVYNSDHLLHPWLDLPRIPQQPQSVTKNRRRATVKAKFMHRHCGTDTLKTYKGHHGRERRE